MTTTYGTKRLANGQLVATRNGIPLAGAERNERVSYSEPEDDPTTQAVLVERPGLIRMHLFRAVPQRRKRLVTWTEPDGRMMGRWTWETCTPRLEVPRDNAR